MRLRTTASLLATVLACVASTPARADDQACNDAYEQGQVLRKDAKLLEAREVFRTCVNECVADAKKNACGEWLAQTEHDIPTVVFSAKDGAGVMLVDVIVSIDGKALAAKLDGKSVEVNPGVHTFSFQSPDGTNKKEIQVVAEQGKKDTPVAVILGAAPAPVPESKSREIFCWPGQTWSEGANSCTGLPRCPGGMVARGTDCVIQTQAPATSGESAPGAPRGEHSSRSVVPLYVAGAGTLVAAGGMVSWFVSDAKYSSLKNDCSSSAGCTRSSYDERAPTIRTLDAISYSAWAVGGAALLGGAIWWALSHDVGRPERPVGLRVHVDAVSRRVFLVGEF
ncbi:MAG TPA: hypothetical protein VGY54_28285 [Polyangiaceae bacterium]|nr:hypothetical protein [Polyangiaceae bacterium]